MYSIICYLVSYHETFNKRETVATNEVQANSTEIGKLQPLLLHYCFSILLHYQSLIVVWNKSKIFCESCSFNLKQWLGLRCIEFECVSFEISYLVALPQQDIVVDPHQFSLPPFFSGREWSSPSKNTISVLMMAAVALVGYFSIKLLVKSIEKLVCK